MIVSLVDSCFFFQSKNKLMSLYLVFYRDISTCNKPSATSSKTQVVPSSFITEKIHLKLRLWSWTHLLELERIQDHPLHNLLHKCVVVVQQIKYKWICDLSDLRYMYASEHCGPLPTCLNSTQTVIQSLHLTWRLLRIFIHGNGYFSRGFQTNLLAALR